MQIKKIYIHQECTQIIKILFQIENVREQLLFSHIF